MTDIKPSEAEFGSALKLHSNEAWDIAILYSEFLASDTRTLAAQIDVALAIARMDERERCAVICDEQIGRAHV